MAGLFNILMLLLLLFVVFIPLFRLVNAIIRYLNRH